MISASHASCSAPLHPAVPVLALALAAPVPGIAADAPPVARSISVTDFGARGDGRHDDTARFGPLASRMSRANGRVFLIGGDIRIEADNLQLNVPCAPDRVWAASASARHASLRARGVVLDGKPAADIGVLLDRQPSR